MDKSNLDLLTNDETGCIEVGSMSNYPNFVSKGGKHVLLHWEKRYFSGEAYYVTEGSIHMLDDANLSALTFIRCDSGNHVCMTTHEAKWLGIE